MADDVDAFTLLAEAAAVDVPISSQRHAKAVGATCRHKSSGFDRAARRVWCKECGVDLDPIDVIGDIARDWDRLVEARQETARLKGQIADLQRKRDNLRAAVVRAERKAVPRG